MSCAFTCETNISIASVIVAYFITILILLFRRVTAPRDANPYRCRSRSGREGFRGDAAYCSPANLPATRNPETAATAPSTVPHATSTSVSCSVQLRRVAKFVRSYVA
jgi:hypothetical protein